MRKNLFLLTFALSVLFISCKKEANATDFTALTKSYFDDKNVLNPLGATQNGQKRIQ